MSEEVRASQPQLEELRRQLRCLKGALAFYANPKSWTCKGEGTLLSCTSLAETDRGVPSHTTPNRQQRMQKKPLMRRGKHSWTKRLTPPTRS